MKTILVVIAQLLFMVSIFFSCNRASIEGVTPVSKQDLQLVTEVERLPSSIVSLGYQKLNAEQKVLIWSRHLDRYLQSSTTSEALKEHINKLKVLNTVDFHNSAGTEQRAALVANFVKDWYTKPVEAGTFSADELLNLCTVHRLGINNSNARSTSNVTPSVEIPNKKKCNCNYNLGCAVRCATGGCQSGATDCGMFGGEKCTGICST